LNVQFVTRERLAAYFTKYVTKNEPLTTVVTEGVSEIRTHLLARRMGAMEIIVLSIGFRDEIMIIVVTNR